MGYLLKEALKTICGVNQWSYAVFWKIGCQNPKLLIWEECYYGPITHSCVPPMPEIENSNFAFHDLQDGLVSPEACNSLGFQGGDRVHLLVNKMMLDNHVHVVGEGLVGRAAFTGNYQWILSQNYTKEFHPPEVLNEMCQQISAGMQTVAVIPVLPHGVVQLGASSAILENMQFVNDVKTLILQLGYVPGVLFSDNFATTDPSSEIGAVVLENSASTSSSGKSKVTHLASYVTDNYNQQNDSPASNVAGQTSNFLIRQIQDNLQSTGPNFQKHQLSVKSNGHPQAQIIPNIRPTIDQRSQPENGITGAEIIISDPKLWRKEEAPFYIPGSMVNQQRSHGPSGTVSRSRISEEKLLVDAAVGAGGLNLADAFLPKWTTAGPSHKPSNPHNVLSGLSEISNVSSLSSARGVVKRHTESEFQNGSQYNTQLSTLSTAKKIVPNHLSTSSSDIKNKFQDKTCAQVDPDRGKQEVKNDMFHGISVPFPPSDNNINLCDRSSGFIHDTQKQNSGYQNIRPAQFDVQSHSQDDLFDVFGINFKNYIFEESWNSLAHDGPGTNSQILEKNNHTSYKLQNACSDMLVVNEGNSDSGALCLTSTDHLLDAVVSSVQAATKQTSDDNLSCRTSLSKISSSYAPPASTSSRRVNTANQMQEVCIDLTKSLPKERAFNSCSFNYEPCKEESEIFSHTKSFYGSQSSSWVEQGPEIKQSTSSTAFSKRTDEISKSNRKRLKPGENPRPRPKDRQMIQDRVKELREIVPNSAKCSIDALLERTIKHMLFLQSVTKHADKVKLTGESKVIKEGGLLLKDNFEGGATWAYEVGSQSMVCPIIVEDLNPPRQMLVEMLCEERGLFLEIADIVRGLGLTILKGVMETRNDKIWARFAVEANRDVTRMEIFLSLVRLLGKTVKSSTVPANCVGNDGAMAHHPFHPGVSVAATEIDLNLKHVWFTYMLLSTVV